MKMTFKSSPKAKGLGTLQLLSELSQLADAAPIGSPFYMPPDPDVIFQAAKQLVTEATRKNNPGFLTGSSFKIERAEQNIIVYKIMHKHADEPIATFTFKPDNHGPHQ